MRRDRSSRGKDTYLKDTYLVGRVRGGTWAGQQVRIGTPDESLTVVSGMVAVSEVVQRLGVVQALVPVPDQASYDEPTGRQLHIALAGLGQLCGWAAFDAGQQGLAQRFYVAALRAAHIADDRPLGVHILGSMTYQAAREGQPAEAVTFTETALAGVAGRETGQPDCIEDAKQLFDAGQTRSATAVQRAIPFAPICQTLTMLRYATATTPTTSPTAAPPPPGTPDKSQPSTLDMITELRRVLIANRNRPTQPTHPQKSTPSVWPGTSTPHDRESRVSWCATCPYGKALRSSPMALYSSKDV